MARAVAGAAYNGRMKLSLPLAVMIVATAPAWSAGPPEPKVQRTVIEDDGARIEELRVRGQTVSITVEPKRGRAPAYQIVPADAAHDTSTPLTRNGLAGQRVWSVMSF